MDFTRLSEDEKINGIKITNVPQYIREKAYLTDFSETLAQLAEMIIQLGVNLGLDPDDALEWARKLQESVSQSEFDSWVATLLDGGPSIFMNTLTELNTKYPNGAPGVALVRGTDPAKIYVWNGSAWEDFGDYQGLEVRDQSVTTDKLADEAVTEDKTTFVEKGDLVSRDMITDVNLSDYRVAENDATMILQTGELAATAAVAHLTTTGFITIQPDLKIRTIYRSLLFYDSNNNILSDGYYQDTTNTQTELVPPKNASKVKITIPISIIGITKLEQSEDVYSRIIRNLILDDNSVKNKNVADKAITVDKTDFLEYGEAIQPDDGKYEVTALTEYRDPERDGYMILSNGSIVTTTNTTAYTVTKDISIIPNVNYEAHFRSLILYDGNGNPILSTYLDNPTLKEPKAFTPPENARTAKLTVHIPSYDTSFITRLSPIESDRSIRFTKNIDIQGGGGEAYDQSLNTHDDVTFSSVTTPVLEVSGEIPVGTLENPPANILAGDMWADTTDSTTHPIVRVKL